MTSEGGKVRVLFLCTGNSCRSQMAEGWLRHLGGDKVEVYSAGVRPIGIVPLTAEVMAQVGVDISSHRSQAAEEFVGEEFDYIITLCDNARANCPYFPGEAVRLHWPIADPYGYDLVTYRGVRDEIRARVEGFLIGIGEGGTGA